MVRGERTLDKFITEVMSTTSSFGMESWLAWSHLRAKGDIVFPEHIEEGSDLYSLAVLWSTKDLARCVECMYNSASPAAS